MMKIIVLPATKQMAINSHYIALRSLEQGYL